MDNLVGKFVGAHWVIVGNSAANSFLVRGGDEPIRIKVQADSSADLQKLVCEANAGIAFLRNVGNYPPEDPKEP